MAKRFLAVLAEFGPVFAGFQIAVAIVSFLGVGAISDWLLTNWFPFTRWVWGQIVLNINIALNIDLPELTLAEKDALTTTLFFLPLGISAVVHRLRTGAPAVKGTLLDREFRSRIYALLIGAGFIYVMGGSVIRDAVEAFGLFISGLRADENNNTAELFGFLLIGDAQDSGSFFEEFGIWVAGASSVAVIAGLVAGFRTRRQARADNSDDAPLERTLRNATKWVGTFSMVVAQLAAVGSIGSAFLTMGTLGWVRLSSIVVVLISLISCVFLNPARLLRTAGVVLALVVTSLVWDLGVFIVHAIEAAPKE